MGLEEREDDDQDFIISEQRHRETTGILKDIAKKLSEDNKGDDKAVAAIEKLIKQIQSLISAEKQEKFEKQPINVDIDTTKFVTSVEQLGNTILTGLNELKEIVSTPSPPKKWEFTVKRNGFSQFIESITAIQK